MALALTVRNSTLLLLFLFSAISARGNDYFNRIYSTINANIENDDFEANFTLISELEEEEDFQKLDCHSKGKIYHKIGVTHYLAYQEADAINYYKEVIQLWINCLPVPQIELANTMYNLGVCHRYLGNEEKAKLFLDQSLDIFENTKEYPSFELGLKYHGIGQFYESFGDLFRAQLCFSNAINLFKQENAILDHFDVLNSSVTLHMDFKAYDQASEYASMALDLARVNPDMIPLASLAPVYLNAATIAFEQKQYDRAENLANKALNSIDREASPQFHATALEILAFLNMERKNFTKAEELMHQVFSIREQFSQEGSGFDIMALTHENFAELYLRQGLLARANEQLAKGFRIVAPNTQLNEQIVPTVSNVEIKNENTIIRLMEMKTRIFEQEYENTGDSEWLQYSLDVHHKIDSVIKKGLRLFQFEQSKLEFLDVRFKHYSMAIQNAMRLYDLTEDIYYLKQAHQFSAMTKALTLQQELNRINALRTTVSDTILEHESILRQTMNDQQFLLFEATAENKDSLLQSFLKAQNALDAFLIRLEEKNPKYYEERYGFLNIPAVRSIQKKLPGDLAVIEFFEAQESIYMFWISNSQFFSRTVPFTPELRKSVEQFTEQCGNPELSISQTNSKFIYQQLMEEGLDHLKNVTRLSIIPDGVLHTLSFEALHDGENYLIGSYAFSYAYSATLLEGKSDTGNTSTEEYVGFAASYSDTLSARLKSKKRFFGEETLSPLLFSKEEVAQASNIFGGSTFVDDQASVENFYKHTNNTSILHLSLHGLVDTDDPNRSCIIFDDSKDDFLLSPLDLYKIRLKTDLVLLSACQSANGKIYNGEGVQGMSKAFLLAGAQNVFSSLWNASEGSSLDITQSFLKNAKQGAPYDVALQKAKLNYFNEVPPSQRHPYYWANFILLGKVEPAKNISWSIMTLVILGVLASATFFFLYFNRRKAL